MQRKRARRIRYRPAVRRGRRGRYRVADPRRFRIARAVLACVAVASLGLSASAVVRSVRTSMLNRSLVAMLSEGAEAPAVEVAAPPLEAARAAPSDSATSPFGTLAAMCLPDGSPIPMPVPCDAYIFHHTDLVVLPEMRKLLLHNPDAVGWLDIDSTLNGPVVYRDNAYYLDHDFTGARNASGTLFLDESAPVGADTQNLLIHGHSMHDGSMFGLLTHYRKLSFLTKHPLIAFSTLWERDTYAVFAVLIVSSDTRDDNYFNYFGHPTFESDAAFDDYVQALRSRSLYDIPADVKPIDALLTLSTCMDDDRLVVVARRQRANEARDALVSAVELAC